MLGLPNDRFVLRFMERVEVRDDGCWEWHGARDKNYGRFYAGDVNERWVHRLAWRLAFGEPVTPGLTIDHLCVFGFCVNPAHMEVVTQAENTRRAAERREPAAHGTTARFWAGCRCAECVTTGHEHRAEYVAEIRRAAAAGERPIPHGTSNGYCLYGCRCRECTDVHSARVKRDRRRKGVKPFQPAQHGTVSRYTSSKWHCRCDECRAAWNAYWKAKRAS